MSIIKLDIKSPVYEFYGEFQRRITLIHGDSGVGKSSLTNILENRIDLPSVTVVCDLDILIASDNNWSDLMRFNKNALVIFDDLRCVETLEFATVCKNSLVENNLYVIIIGRADLPYFSCINEKNKRALSISLDEIYNLINDGSIKHWLEHDYVAGFSDLTNVDMIITEDRGTGYRFFSTYLKNVKRSTDGKSSIINNVESSSGKKILVLLDTAAYGVHFEEFKQKIVAAGINARYLNGLESFEYLLLRTNLLRDNKRLSNAAKVVNVDDYISWEDYFGTLLKYVTDKTPQRSTHTRHSVLADCFTIECKDCKEEFKRFCDFTNYDINDKFVFLLSDTEFERLLDLPRNSNTVNSNDINVF